MTKIKNNFQDLDPMTKQYVVTALWSTNDESTPQGGEPFDANFSGSDIDPKSVARMGADCQAFLDLVGTELPFVLAEADSTDLGHDFWVTRAGHGAGFWDGDYRWLDRDGVDVGEKLTEMSKRFPARSLYLGDDGHVYEASA
jgi:hypothetical protein